MSDFYDELTAANAEFITEAGEPVTYDGVAFPNALVTEADPLMQLLPAGESADDELTVEIQISLFVTPPVAKKRMVYNGVTYNCRNVFPVSGGMYRFKCYRTKPGV